VLAHDRQRQRAGFAHRDAFGKRRAAARLVIPVDRIPHRRIKRRFNADDLDRRLFGARGNGISSNQAAAADRDDENVEIGRVFQLFQRNGALAGDNVRIVIGMHPDEVLLLGDCLGAHLRLRHRLAVQHDGRAMRFGRLHLHERRRDRHDDGGGNTQAPGVIGHRLGVIAGRHGDHAAAALGRGERRKFYAGTPFLERIGHLQILVFDVNARSGERRELRRRQKRRAQHLAGHDAPGGLDIGKRDLHRVRP